MVRTELVAFGAAIRRQRLRLSISQEQLAKRSALHRTYVSGVERGERNLGLINVYRLADALDIPAAELFATAEAARRTAQRASRGRQR
jgi:transcriptional regulator with XRE-family HTH domain